MLVRSVPDPFFEALDCADPSLLTPKRTETLTALHALAIWNDRFVLRHAEHLAVRVDAETSDPWRRDRARDLARARARTDGRGARRARRPRGPPWSLACLPGDPQPRRSDVRGLMLDRRQLLRHFGGGLGSIALASLLRREHGGTHHAPARETRRAGAVHVGAASQVDTFDHKPELERRHGRPFDVGEKVELFQSSPGTWMKSPGAIAVTVSAAGSSATSCPPRAPGRRSRVHPLDDVAFERARSGDLPAVDGLRHAWVPVDGRLGRLRPRLPRRRSADLRRASRCSRLRTGGPSNWSAGFLPAAHQGTVIRPDRASPIHDLFPPRDIEWIDDDAETEGRALLRSLNERHVAQRPGDSRLDARIRAYELAAQLQIAAPEVLDLRGESRSTRELSSRRRHHARLGTRCLLTRRLLERGVRFVWVWSSTDNGFPRRNWDSHEDLRRDTRRWRRRWTSRPPRSSST